MKIFSLMLLVVSSIPSIAFANECYYSDTNGVEYKISDKAARYVTNDFQAFPDREGYNQRDLKYYDSLLNKPFKVTKTEATTLDSVKYSSFLSKYRLGDIVVDNKAYITDAFYNIQLTTSDCQKFYYDPSRKNLKSLQYDFIRTDGKTITSKNYFDFLGKAVREANIETSSEYDKFEKKTLLKTDYFDQYLIRGMLDKTNKKSSNIQIYLDTTVLTKALAEERSWNNISVAKDTDGNSHQVVQISRNPDCSSTKLFGCTLHETIGIDVSEKFLRSHLNGFELKMIGSNTFVKEINGDVVKSFVNEIDRLKSLK